MSEEDMKKKNRVVNVLVTGASGLLGRTIVKYLTNADYQAKYPLDLNNDKNDAMLPEWNVLGLCYSRARAKLRRCDLNDHAEVRKLVEDEFKPDVIIHAAAERRPDAFATQSRALSQAVELNCAATEHLARLAARLDIFFVYISTDYVFGGESAPYKTSDPARPINKYGETKFKGEELTRLASKKHVLVRVPVLYGLTEHKNLSESAVTILFEKMISGGDGGGVKKEFKCDAHQRRFPTHTIDVARFLTALLRKHYNNNNNNNNNNNSSTAAAEKGEGEKNEATMMTTLHCSAPDVYTKYDMCMLMAKVCNNSNNNNTIATTEHIVKDMTSAVEPPITKAGSTSTSTSTRPFDCQLDTNDSFAYLDNFETCMRFADSIKECLESEFQ